MNRISRSLRTLLTLTSSQRRLLGLGIGLMFVARLASLVLPASSRFLVDNVLRARQRGALLPLVALIATATLIQAVAEYFRTRCSARANENLVVDFRLRLHRHITLLTLRDYEASPTGLWHSRIMGDLEGIRNFLGPGVIESAGSILTVLVTLGILLYLSPWLTLMVLACAAGFGFAVLRLVGTMRPLLRERMRLEGELAGFLAESLRGFRVVKAYGAEPRMRNEFALRLHRLSLNLVSSADLHATVNFLTILLSGGVLAILMYLGSRLVLASRMTVGTLVEYFVFVGFLVPPLIQLARAGAQFNHAAATLERATEVFRLPLESQSRPRSLALARVDGEIVFENVSFSYGSKRALLDVSFTARPGTVTALVGASGAGKSTIINLIAGFYWPASGRITVDGFDLTTVALDSYRAQLGIVLQDATVFDGTIYDNVLFGRPGASPDTVLSACRAAYVDVFASRLRDGYQTRIGENGVTLSAGERQRIAIARAIVSDPRVLILDEATSNLDLHSEFLVQRALRALMAGRTTFIAAHRLSTVEHADLILVLDSNHIVERGRHETLWAKRGRYYEIMHAAAYGQLAAMAGSQGSPQGSADYFRNRI